ncbi:hypothetical protein CANCADRAFT_23368 [Tortispora caseinolytica NRRL Y-17796]|uniref:37S ribosomal protein S35, mitochondrial n=1 Tax=Tortispora caseinolytica NRRL Y-17796 TaxID=767744 RepID=A0A1E4TMJ9_9ASCO|nr:hypothetical protein CANCADRAFT_23368 [Tortispora caseinolytica NRRL Y-17796]
MRTRIRPQYPVRNTFTEQELRGTTRWRQQMVDWLGPKNMKGEYVKNRYARLSSNHVPNFFVAQNREFGLPWKFIARPYPEALRPFPMNPFTVSGLALSPALKEDIVHRVLVEKQPVRAVSEELGVKPERILAVIRLAHVEDQLQQADKIEPDAVRMEQRLYKALPIFEGKDSEQNISEVAMPIGAKKPYYAVVGESEIITADAAAKELRLHPAADVLQKSFETAVAAGVKKTKSKAVLGSKYEGDKFSFKFVPAKSGKVGLRYGAARDDRKEYRKVVIDSSGRMRYA